MLQIFIVTELTPALCLACLRGSWLLEIYLYIKYMKYKNYPLLTSLCNFFIHLCFTGLLTTLPRSKGNLRTSWNNIRYYFLRFCEHSKSKPNLRLAALSVKITGKKISYKTKLVFPACLSVHQYVWHHQLASHSSLTKATSLAALAADRACGSRLTNPI